MQRVLDFHSCFQIKDLITVFSEDEPSVKIPDLLGMWGWGGVWGSDSVPGHLILSTVALRVKLIIL
jgi:hypothetical protein